jgi:hypothetical protein
LNLVEPSDRGRDTELRASHADIPINRLTGEGPMETLIKLDDMCLEKKGKQAWVTFTRESHLNAVSNNGTVELNRVAMAIREDPDIRLVVIRGQGRAFCTGIDLKELSADRLDMSYHQRWEKALRVFEQMEKIVVAGHSRMSDSGFGHLAPTTLYRMGAGQETHTRWAKHQRRTSCLYRAGGSSDTR